ncbi:MAG: hypothetical protein ACLPKT_11835 [Methylocella sp.]
MKRQQIKEEAFAVILPNRMIGLYDRNVLAIFLEKAPAMAFKRVMATRGMKCRVVKCETTFSLPAPTKRKKA